MPEFSSFARLIHEVYPHLHDRVFLQDHPLLRMLGGSTVLGPDRLHRTLIDALEWLRPIGSASLSSVEWRRYRHLQLRYLEGASPEQIARELQVSPRQARRDHTDALDEVARLIWSRLMQSRGESRSTPTRPVDSLDAEISILTAAAASPTRIAEVLRGVVETVSRLATSNRVRLVVDAPPGESVTLNRTMMRQLLLNLVSDAIVHHPGATIEIHAKLAECSVELSISSVIVRSETTQRDEQPVPADESSQFGISTGVLDVSRRLAQSQGGSLRDTLVSGHSAINLTLPVARGETLLLVDDNPDVSLLFRRFLGGTKYHLIQARSAERAIRLARELQPVVVFLDVLMPSHDGWEILQSLRAEPATAKLKVVICSVIPDHALALSLGVADFLNKPVTRQALLDVLARLPRQSQADDLPEPPEPSDTIRPRAARPTD